MVGEHHSPEARWCNGAGVRPPVRAGRPAPFPAPPAVSGRCRSERAGGATPRRGPSAPRPGRSRATPRGGKPAAPPRSARCHHRGRRRDRRWEPRLGGLAGGSPPGSHPTRRIWPTPVPAREGDKASALPPLSPRADRRRPARPIRPPPPDCARYRAGLLDPCGAEPAGRGWQAGSAPRLTGGRRPAPPRRRVGRQRRRPPPRPTPAARPSGPPRGQHRRFPCSAVG